MDKLVERLSVFRRFLDGSGEWEGKYFDDRMKTAAGIMAVFWWRRDLTMIDEAAARIQALEAGVKLAAVWFDEYALMHRAKGTAEGNDKSERNQARADQLRAILRGEVEPQS